MSRRLVLASGSPRRLSLLREAGFDPHVRECDIDDALVARGCVTPEEFVMALSWFKATRTLARFGPVGGLLIAADTVCVDGDVLMGKPRDAEDARRMLSSLQQRSHRVVTGVTIVGPDAPRRIFVDVARVALGALSGAAIDAYVASGQWRGKAGAYNFAERVADGWPLACNGDPTGVMGLPMRRVIPLLERLGVERREVPA